MIAHVVRPGNSLGVAEEIVGIQSGALSEPPTAAVKIVATLFENDIDDGAAVVAELSRETVVLHLEFLNDFHRRLVVDVGGRAFALFRGAG